MFAVDRKLEIAVEAALVRAHAHVLKENSGREVAEARWNFARARQLSAEAEDVRQTFPSRGVTGQAVHVQCR